MNNYYKKEVIDNFNNYKTHLGLSQIKIGNFKSISHNKPQKINLYPLTIICGENSSGKSTLLNSVLLLTQILRTRGKNGNTEDTIELNGQLIQLSKFDQIINKTGSSDEVSLGFSYLTLKEHDTDGYGVARNPMYVNVDLTLESTEDETFKYYPQLKNYRIVTNEISSKGGSYKEINEASTDLPSLVTHAEEIVFEKKEVLKKINNEMETGIISFTNPRSDSVKKINNSWICSFKKKNLEINQDFKNNFENDNFNWDNSKTTKHYGVKFDSGLPRQLQNRKNFFEEYPALLSRSIESYFNNEVFIENNLFAYEEWEDFSEDEHFENINVISSTDQIREELINSFSNIFDISDFLDLLSDEDKELEESNKAMHLKLNDAPFITSDYKTIYKNKFELAQDLMELVNDAALIDEIFKYDLENIGYGIKIDDQQDKLDFFNSAINQQFWINFQEAITKKIGNLVSHFDTSENIMIDLSISQTIIDSEYEDIYSINSSLGLNSAHNYVKYIGPLRNLNNSEPRVYEYDDNIPLGLSGEYFFNYYFDAVEKLPSLKNEFNNYLAYFEIASEFDTEYDPNTNSINGKIKPIGLDSSIGMKSLGVGFSQLAPLILLCITSRRGSTILMEQPELHLHPSVQQKIGDFLIKVMEEKEIQIIVETHSDHLLNRLRRRIAQAKLEKLDDNLFEKCGIYFAERTDGVTEFREAKLTKSATYDMTDFPKGFFDQGAEDAFYILKASLEE